MKKLTWPESDVPCYFECSYCDMLIMPEINQGETNTWYTPSSRYWDYQKQKIYCCIDCMIGNTK
jgi:hypothetical protein